MKVRELKRAFYIEVDGGRCCEFCNDMWVDWPCPICKHVNRWGDICTIHRDMVLECYRCKSKFKIVMEDYNDAVVELVE